MLTFTSALILVAFLLSTLKTTAQGLARHGHFKSTPVLTVIFLAVFFVPPLLAVAYLARN